VFPATYSVPDTFDSTGWRKVKARRLGCLSFLASERCGSRRYCET
jgi:hypothetical protein